MLSRSVHKPSTVSILVAALAATQFLHCALDGGAPERHRVISIGVGPAGITYSGGTAEDHRWGPSAFALPTRGDGVVVSDVAARRVVEFAPNGTVRRSLDVSPLAVGVLDLEVEGDTLWLLDGAAQTPSVLHVDWNGTVLARAQVPEEAQRGLTGVTIEDGDLVLEVERGARLYKFDLEAGSLQAMSTHSHRGHTAIAHAADLTGRDLTRGWVEIDGLRVAIESEYLLAGAEVLAQGDEGDVFVRVEEARIVPEVEVHVTVRHLAPDGRLLGAITVPTQDRAVAPRHDVAVDRNGAVWIMRPGLTHVEFSVEDETALARPPFTQSSEPLVGLALPSADAPTFPSPLAELTGSRFYSGISCIRWSQINANAGEYLSTSVALTTANIDRGRAYCSVRQVPLYLGSAGTYSSVPYDWGGFSLPTQFVSGMASTSPRYVAGDVYTYGSGTSCSLGVDCSGFVSRVWGLLTKYGTATIANGSSGAPAAPLCSGTMCRAPTPGDAFNKAGSHIRLYAAAGSNGAYMYEATRDSYLDRVAYTYWTWSQLQGYQGIRYKSFCP